MCDRKPIIIGMALAMSWLTRSAWRREESEVEHLFDLEHYVALAQQAEQAKLDFLFAPDTLFLAKEALAHEAGFTGFDPTTLIAAMASHTHRIGLVSTVSTTFTPPYIAARQLQSLNWLTKGRAGWNIVTALGGNENFGLETMPSSQQRYAKAHEFVEVVNRLWQSYPHTAIKADRASGQFANVDDIEEIHHHGEFFDVLGPLNIPTHPSGRMPFFQAGASDAGRNFAAHVADVMFAATPDIESGIALKQDLASRCQQIGRSPSALKVLPGVALYLAESEQEAHDLFTETHREIDPAKHFAHLHKALGIDFSNHNLDDVVEVNSLAKGFIPYSQTHTDLLLTYIQRESPTLRQLLARPEVIGSSHWLIIGTVQQAYDDIVQRLEQGAADGFIAVPGGSKESMRLFFESLIPMLQQNGWFKSEYIGDTLATHLTEQAL